MSSFHCSDFLVCILSHIQNKLGILGRRSSKYSHSCVFRVAFLFLSHLKAKFWKVSSSRCYIAVINGVFYCLTQFAVFCDLQRLFKLHNLIELCYFVSIKSVKFSITGLVLFHTRHFYWLMIRLQNKKCNQSL